MPAMDERASLPTELAEAIREHREISAIHMDDWSESDWQRHDELIAKRERFEAEFLIPQATANAVAECPLIVEIAERVLETVQDVELDGIKPHVKTLRDIQRGLQRLDEQLTHPFCDSRVTGDASERTFLIFQNQGDWIPIAKRIRAMWLEISKAATDGAKAGRWDPVRGDRIKQLAERARTEVEALRVEHGGELKPVAETKPLGGNFSGWHKLSDSPPVGFYTRESLTGTKDQLARAIVIGIRAQRPDRTLNKKMCTDPGLWGRVVLERRSYQVFFNSKDRFDEANGRFGTE